MSMSVKEFIKKYLASGGVDYDGAFDKQCVDLFRAYHRDVLSRKTQPRSVIGAKDFWAHYETDPALHDNYIKIRNTPDFVPREGDVMIWGSGPYGHIAICTGKGDRSWFESLDQNWHGKNRIALIKHDYSGVYGVLRPKMFAERPTPGGGVSMVAWLDEDIPTEVEKELDLKSVPGYDNHWSFRDIVNDWADLHDELDKCSEAYNGPADQYEKLAQEMNKKIHDAEKAAKEEAERQARVKYEAKIYEMGKLLDEYKQKLSSNGIKSSSCTDEVLEFVKQVYNAVKEVFE